MKKTILLILIIFLGCNNPFKSSPKKYQVQYYTNLSGDGFYNITFINKYQGESIKNDLYGEFRYSFEARKGNHLMIEADAEDNYRDVIAVIYVDGTVFLADTGSFTKVEGYLP